MDECYMQNTGHLQRIIAQKQHWSELLMIIEELCTSTNSITLHADNIIKNNSIRFFLELWK